MYNVNITQNIFIVSMQLVGVLEWAGVDTETMHGQMTELLTRDIVRPTQAPHPQEHALLFKVKEVQGLGHRVLQPRQQGSRSCHGKQRILEGVLAGTSQLLQLRLRDVWLQQPVLTFPTPRDRAQ